MELIGVKFYVIEIWKKLKEYKYFDSVNVYICIFFFIFLFIFIMLLQRYYNQLREEIVKMKFFEGLEDEEEGESIDFQGVYFFIDSALSSVMNSFQLVVIENFIIDFNFNFVLEDGFC